MQDFPHAVEYRLNIARVISIMEEPVPSARDDFEFWLTLFDFQPVSDGPGQGARGKRKLNSTIFILKWRNIREELGFKVKQSAVQKQGFDFMLGIDKKYHVSCRSRTACLEVFSFLLQAHTHRYPEG
jgi:hypothetical protein